MFTHRHAEGGVYTMVGLQAGKHPETGKWIPGICYRDIDGEIRWTDEERWAERFEELPPSRFQAEQQVNLTDPDDSDVVIASYTFRIDQVDDVRYLLVSAGKNASKLRDHHVERVLEAQAEMVSQGLHLRDLDVGGFIDFIGDIEAFHQKFGLEYVGKPRILPSDLFDFRSRFIDEELQEWREEQAGLVVALTSDDGHPDHRRVALGLHQQLDALVDLTYVVLGAAYLQFGPTIFREAWRRVQAANMAKVRAERAEDSKRGSAFDVVKPAGWEPPDHHDLVKDHSHFPVRAAPEAESRTFNEVVSTDYTTKA
jgi:predicted HAD superfamily Cof-like phosphohydrolase